MIPRRLKLQNFLSYRECDLDLTGLHLAVLCGRNGEGKSALLDAMTWALWGEGRGRVEDDRIHLSEQVMQVQFDFEVSGDCFRVIRKRTRGRGSGTLDLFQFDEEGRLVSLSGGTIRETQAEIIQRVRMDYETFVNSAFVAQGRANEFTRKPPGERKEVFRKVLGLERYELLAAAANERRRTAASSLKSLEQRTEEGRAEVVTLPQVKAELTAVAGGLQELGPRLEALESAAGELRQAANDYTRLREQAASAAHRRDASAMQLEQAESQLASVEHEDAAARALLATAPAVRERYALLVDLRARERDLAARQAGAATLEHSMAAARQALAEERVRLEGQVAAAERDVAAAREAAGCLPALAEALGHIDEERAGQLALEVAIEKHRSAENDHRGCAAAARNEAEQAVARGRELKAKESQLDGAGRCPVCRQPLSPGDLEHVRNEYAQERHELGDRYHAAIARAEQAERAAEAAKDAAGHAQRELLERREAVERAAGQLQSRREAAETAEASIPALEESLALVRETLATDAFAAGPREELGQLAAAQAALGYDPVAHTGLRKQVEELAPAEAEYRAVAAAEERAAERQQSMARLRESVCARRDDLVAATAEAAAAAEALAAAADVSSRLDEAEQALGEARVERDDLMRRQGTLEERQRALSELAARLETALSEAAALKEEEAVYGELARAFGKDGVQAMLIDQSLPRLEVTANEMLDRMTGGRIHVALATQRTSAAGKVSETLDIRISDDLGTRDYEMYSGGEAFRVDFALRIALSRLLAERSGADLPTLIIDEGFGTQDPEGIDRLVEALNAISQQFRLVLVVTHVEDLRERFERRIEVVKDPVRGSIARVM